MLSQFCFAQIKEDSIKKRFTVGGSFGYGFPMGNYATITPDMYFTNNSMFADPGIHCDLDFNCQFSEHWGVVLFLNENFNKLDPGYFSYLSFESPDQEINYTGSGGAYNLGNYFIGPYYSNTFFNGDIFEIELAGGLISLHQSPINYTLYFNNLSGFPHTSYSTQPAQIYFGLGLELGLKFKILITKGLYITLNSAFIVNDAFTDFHSNVYNPFEILTGCIGLEYKF